MSSQTTARSPSAQSAAVAYLALSLAVAGIVVWGFWPSYFGPLIAGTAARPWFIHAHAAVPSATKLDQGGMIASSPA